jgi:hypothetical protein
MTNIPDDVYAQLYEYLQNRAAGLSPVSAALIAVLPEPPRSQPEPAWQLGDVVLMDGVAYIVGTKPGLNWLGQGTIVWRFRKEDGSPVWRTVLPDAEPLFVGGRRVHPPRFADHAAALRDQAEYIESENYPHTADLIRRIADDLAGDSDE